jgi:hypothetical protein
VTARPLTEPTVELEDGLVIEGDADRDLVDDLALHDFEDEAPTQPLSPLPTNYEYRDWKPEDTQVVTYTTMPERYTRDRVVVSKAQAKAQVEAIHGRILETNEVPGRFFFRVMRAKQS